MPPSPVSARSVTVVRRPSPAMLAGIAEVAAWMARADGSADGQERQALLRFLREHDLLQHFGRQACLDAYDSALSRDETPSYDASAATAPLIASAAASIAMADGTVHPAELDLLGHLAERLNVLGETDAVVSLLFRRQ